MKTLNRTAYTLLVLAIILGMCSCNKEPSAIKYRFETHRNGKVISSYEMEYRDGNLTKPGYQWKGKEINDTAMEWKSSDGIQAYGKKVGDSITIGYWDFEERGVKI
jgi:hypothetical protein